MASVKLLDRRFRAPYNSHRQWRRRKGENRAIGVHLQNKIKVTAEGFADGVRWYGGRVQDRASVTARQ